MSRLLTSTVLLLASVLVGAVVASVDGQAQAGNAFEVASIKPCGSGDPGAGGRTAGGNPRPRWSPGRLTIVCQPAMVFIQSAYVQYAGGRPHAPLAFLSTQVDAAPAWLSSERYTISAEARNGANFEMMMGPMMQALLEDRFKLKIRYETKEGPVYALTMAKGGSKLADTANAVCSRRDANTPLKPSDPPYCVFDMKADASDLGVLLRPFLDRPVIDRTGIRGTFEFRLVFAPDETITGFPPQDPTQPSIFVAIQEQLGLKLESVRGPVDVLVIDHVEHPTPD
jgi:uncharacterized protein (TIGR03435 family)